MRLKLCLACVSAVALSLPAFAKRTAKADVPECVSVIKACDLGGYGPRSAGKKPHGGKGLWIGCVHPLSRGQSVPGVSGVSKQVALSCLNAHHAKRRASGV